MRNTILRNHLNVQFRQISIPTPRKVIYGNFQGGGGGFRKKETFPWEGYGYFILLIPNMNKIHVNVNESVRLQKMISILSNFHAN